MALPPLLLVLALSVPMRLVAPVTPAVLLLRSLAAVQDVQAEASRQDRGRAGGCGGALLLTGMAPCRGARPRLPSKLRPSDALAPSISCMPDCCLAMCATRGGCVGRLSRVAPLCRSLTMPSRGSLCPSGRHALRMTGAPPQPALHSVPRAEPAPSHIWSSVRMPGAACCFLSSHPTCGVLLSGTSWW